MSDFIINTPSHKRWYLPDGRHLYNTVIFGTNEHIRIIEALTNETKESVTLDINSKTYVWEDLSQLTQELAAKKYPKELRHKSSNIHRQRIGL